jgi:hypothetical protein
MFRFSLLMLIAASAFAADSAVDIDTAASLYQAGQVRVQVQASLGAMPAHVRQLFTADGSNKLSDQQLAAVTAAAKHGFRIDVFEPPALSALAANLDQATVRKAQAFLDSDLGRRMVAADVAAAQLDEATIDQVMSGALVHPGTAERDALMDKLERASQYTESTVQIFLTMGQAVATGTATGSGMDPIAVTQRARKSSEASRAGLQESMREPLRRYMAYGYRDLSIADLKHLVAFFDSAAGKHYTAAYIAAMSAGFDAMGRHCGEELGESLRELAQAQMPPEGMAPEGSADASPGEAAPRAAPHP